MYVLWLNLRETNLVDIETLVLLSKSARKIDKQYIFSGARVAERNWSEAPELYSYTVELFGLCCMSKDWTTDLSIRERIPPYNYIFFSFGTFKYVL